MPYANNQGVRIHFQLTGDGSPLVLQHGFNASVEDWYEFGYVEKLNQEHRLILVDARGHGASDKPHEPEAYELKRLVSDIVVVLDDLHVIKAHYLGYSMGGWIGFGMAKYASTRLDSLIIGGAQPYGNSFVHVRETLSNGIEAWVAIVERWGLYSPEALVRTRNNDVHALLAAIQDRPDMSDILPSMNMPCLLYAVSADAQCQSIEQCAGELSNANCLSLPDLNHFEAIPRSDLVAPHIIEFLASL